MLGRRDRPGLPLSLPDQASVRSRAGAPAPPAQGHSAGHFTALTGAKGSGGVEEVWPGWGGRLPSRSMKPKAFSRRADRLGHFLGQNGCLGWGRGGVSRGLWQGFGWGIVTRFAPITVRRRRLFPETPALRRDRHDLAPSGRSALKFSPKTIRLRPAEATTMQQNGPCSNEYSVVSPGSSVKGRPRRSFPNTSPSFSVMSPSAPLVSEG